MASLTKKLTKKLNRAPKAPKVPKVQILQSMLIKAPTTSSTKTCTTTEKPPPKPSGVLTQMDPVPPPQGLPLLDDNLSVITIHSDNSTFATGNMGENFELDMLLAQLEGDPAADFLFEPARIVPTPTLSAEAMRSPIPPPQLPPLQLHLPPPPPPPLPAATPAPAPPTPAESGREAGKKRSHSHDHASSTSGIKKRGKNLGDMMHMVDLEEGYRPERPSPPQPLQSSQQEGGSLQPKTPRELALTTYSSLKQMEPVYRAKLLEARVKTAELERQLEAAKADEKRLEKDEVYIGEFLKFLKCRK
ncbi:uncharacterized protein LOC116159238 [Photinus pyralis]|uniref:uncharacterized protein LOC116159238 n=1 Tax=Photinus pyralis TaxID=7054 RepID=UPI001266F4AB|nr:uncharacterized protein LOC116159238 [Photinus pyralis]